MNDKQRQYDVDARTRDFRAVADAYVALDNDPHLANYMVRDLAITHDARQTFLAWELHRGNPTRLEVKLMLDKIATHALGDVGPLILLGHGLIRRLTALYGTKGHDGEFVERCLQALQELSDDAGV